MNSYKNCYYNYDLSNRIISLYILSMLNERFRWNTKQNVGKIKKNTYILWIIESD